MAYQMSLSTISASLQMMEMRVGFAPGGISYSSPILISLLWKMENAPHDSPSTCITRKPRTHCTWSSMECSSTGDYTVNPSLLIIQAESPAKVSYNVRDLLIYALGIGCSTRRTSSDQANEDELHFLYESHPTFCAFPTFPLVLPYKGISSGVVAFPGKIHEMVHTSSPSSCEFVTYTGLRWNCRTIVTDTHRI